MKIRMVIRFAGWPVLVALVGAAGAGPLEDAAAAHERGDDAIAVRLLLPLAEAGDGLAQFALGFIYDTAKGIPQDDVAAARWYRKAADQGIAGAQYNLGAMYADGHGVPRDYVEAYKWLSLAIASSTEHGDSALVMRERVAKRMTSEEIATAQKLAREWKPK